MRYFLLRVIVLMMASAPVFAQTITGKVTIASDGKPFPDPTHISITNMQL